MQITMFEILTGRTPFEADDQEQFSTPEELVIYYERTRKGHWVGQWSIPSDIETLLRQMINPDPAYRISAMEAYHHPALQPNAPNVIITPHFVRAAASFDVEEEPLPPPPAQTYVVAEDHHIQAKGDTAKEKEKKEKGKSKRKNKRYQSATSHGPPPSHPHLHVRATTPALGESIKQHTSVSKPKRDRSITDLGGSGALSGMSDGKENENEHMEVSAGEEKEKEKKRSKLVIRKLRMEEEADDKDVSGEDPTRKWCWFFLRDLAASLMRENGYELMGAVFLSFST